MTSQLSMPPSTPPTLETVVDARNANPDGDLFGGWLMAQMDLAGGSRAFGYAGGRVVTAGVDALSFLKPIFIGDLLRFYTRIDRVGRTSIVVMIEAWGQRGATGPFEKMAEGRYTFVAVDGQFRPKPLPVRAA